MHHDNVDLFDLLVTETNRYAIQPGAINRTNISRTELTAFVDWHCQKTKPNFIGKVPMQMNLLKLPFIDK